jgi:hypothetical protein
MAHVHAFELVLKGSRLALFLCECGTSRTAPVDDTGRMELWNTSAIKTPSEELNGSTGGGGNGD